MSIEIQSIIYLYNGDIVEYENIPTGEVYYQVHLNEQGEQEYAVTYQNQEFSMLTCYSNESEMFAKAEQVIEHFFVDKPMIEYSDSVSMQVILPAEEFEFDLELSETESYVASATLEIELHGNWNEPKLAKLSGEYQFLIEINESEPLAFLAREVLMDKDKQILVIKYGLFSVDENQLLEAHHHLIEYSENGFEAFGDEHYDGDRYFPIRPTYLADVAKYIDKSQISTCDLEGNPLEQIPTDPEIKHYRQWYSSENALTVSEVISLNGIAHTEILDVPQELHFEVAHAYLRHVHFDKQLISLDYVTATTYVVVYEPISYESTDMIPLEEGQFKRYSSIYTYRSVRVVCECQVFTQEGELVNKYSFGDVNEQNPLFNDHESLEES